MHVSSSLLSWKQVNGGIPQGTKLGLMLFAVMINKLLKNWHMRSKYVDDTTAFEIIPRNSLLISILDLVVREIHDYCKEHDGTNLHDYTTVALCTTEREEDR